MKNKRKAALTFYLLCGYILFQFLWWEILLVKQTGSIIEEKQRIAELTISSPELLRAEIAELHRKKRNQTIMVTGEGTVFLLLLLAGFSRIWISRKKELELTARQKNFLITMTHELKTPVSATKLNLQTLRRPDIDAETQRMLLTEALAANERLNSLIDNVLVAGRIESGSYRSGESQTQKELRDAGVLIHDLAKRYYPRELDEAKLQLHAETGIELELDSQAFTSVFLNLTDNALKYASPPVQVTLARSAEAIVLGVADQGPQIEKQEEALIFGKYFRGTSDKVSSNRGTGLGLYIVKSMADKEGYSIKLKSNPPHGNLFEVCIPLS
jgi:signal transduction histidine kinase